VPCTQVAAREPGRRPRARSATWSPGVRFTTGSGRSFTSALDRRRVRAHWISRADRRGRWPGRLPRPRRLPLPGTSGGGPGVGAHPPVYRPL